MFCQQNVHSLKKTLLPCLYAVQKHPNIHLLKNTVLSCRFFKVFMKNPILPCPYFIKKRELCQNYTVLWTQKVKTMPFFSYCSLKISLTCPYFVKSPFSKKSRCSHAHILSKKIPFSQKQTLLMSSFSIFSGKTSSIMPIFGKKTSILSKLHFIMG